MSGFRFRSLVSGSSANATLIEGPGTQPGTGFRVLVDCGLNMRQLKQHLAQEGLDVSDIQAIFVTHEHSDHVGACFDLAKQYGIPLWCSYGTWLGAGQPDCGQLWQQARDGQAIQWGGMQALPLTVPHDAREPLQLVISSQNERLALITDLGYVTEHVLAHVQNCQALLLEFNHEPELLQRSRYPAFLKRRISGRLGHLSNAAAAQLLEQALHAGLQHVVAAHLSRQNNRPEQVVQWMAQATQGQAVALHVASQESGSPWIVLRAAEAAAEQSPQEGAAALQMTA